MNLNFTNLEVRSKALSTTSIEYNDNITSAEAFIIVLKDLDYDTISNLCGSVSSKLLFNNPHKIYEIIQSNNCDLDTKQIILDSAYELIHNGISLGNKIINGKFNASSWIEHSLYEGEVSKTLAHALGLNPDIACKLGLLHDIGRKLDHSFAHTIKGYEYLLKNGLNEEAVCALTHSFLSNPINGILKGNRCANCEPSFLGFYVDSNGNGVIHDEVKKDDITLFLENYQYSLYDVILNVSDLMAMSSGIVSPYERVMDVYTRKTPDPKNSPFFKVCFINTLRRLLYKINNDQNCLKYYNILDFKSIEDIEKTFIETSNYFMSTYNSLLNKEKINTIK